MNFRLGAGRYVDALDFAVIFDGRRKYLPLEAEKHRRFDVPAAASSWAVEGALNHGIEDDLPAFEFWCRMRPHNSPLGLTPSQDSYILANRNPGSSEFDQVDREKHDKL